MEVIHSGGRNAIYGKVCIHSGGYIAPEGVTNGSDLFRDQAWVNPDSSFESQENFTKAVLFGVNTAINSYGTAYWPKAHPNSGLIKSDRISDLDSPVPIWSYSDPSYNHRYSLVFERVPGRSGDYVYIRDVGPTNNVYHRFTGLETPETLEGVPGNYFKMAESGTSDPANEAAQIFLVKKIGTHTDTFGDEFTTYRFQNELNSKWIRFNGSSHRYYQNLGVLQYSDTEEDGGDFFIPRYVTYENNTNHYSDFYLNEIVYPRSDSTTKALFSMYSTDSDGTVFYSPPGVSNVPYVYDLEALDGVTSVQVSRNTEPTPFEITLPESPLGTVASFVASIKFGGRLWTDLTYINIKSKPTLEAYVPTESPQQYYLKVGDHQLLDIQEPWGNTQAFIHKATNNGGALRTGDEYKFVIVPESQNGSVNTFTIKSVARGHYLYFNLSTTHLSPNFASKPQNNVIDDNPRRLFSAVKDDVNPDKIYIFTPKGIREQNAISNDAYLLGGFGSQFTIVDGDIVNYISNAIVSDTYKGDSNYQCELVPVV